MTLHHPKHFTLLLISGVLMLAAGCGPRESTNAPSSGAAPSTSKKSPMDDPSAVMLLEGKGFKLERAEGGVVAVVATGGELSDADLEHVAALPGLRRLVLTGNSQITNAGLEPIAGLTALKELKLSSPKIDDDGLRHLARLKNLRSLGLDGTHVASLDALRALDNLQELYLFQTKMTDDSLAAIGTFPQLRRLRLRP